MVLHHQGWHGRKTVGFGGALEPGEGADVGVQCAGRAVGDLPAEKKGAYCMSEEVTGFFEAFWRRSNV